MNKNWRKFTNIAKDIRRDIIRMHSKANSSHVGSSLSCVDILVCLYFGIMKIDIKNLTRKNQDKFILSKGHAVSALYAALSKRGYFLKKVLEQYCVSGTKLSGHSTRGCVRGIEASTGSLGHGLSIGVGMALSARFDRLKYRIFVLLSDGECDEGSVWEAAMFASHHKLDNLIAIIDYNKLQAFGKISEVVNLEPLRDKWISFGWSVKEVDGHNFEELMQNLKKLPFEKEKPSLLMAHTIKGKGVSFMENRIEWHYHSPNHKQAEAALSELR